MSEYLEDEEDLITQQEMGFIPEDDGGAEWYCPRGCDNTHGCKVLKVVVE